MAIDSEVLVVGGGLAGSAAALAAAGTGARVRLVSRAETTLRQASGLVDVLGSVDGDLVADPFAAIGDLPPDHPYGLVGAGAVRAGLALFDDAVGDRYAGGHTGRNALVPTAGGAVKPTARYPATVADGLASDPRDALLVGFETAPGFDAPLAAAHLRAAGVPFDVRGVTVSFPGIRRADAERSRYAALLEGGGRDADEDAVAALAAAVEPHLRDQARVGFPALLGERDPGAVVAGLEAALGTAVFEVPTGPPSLPGRRLEDALRGALREAGVAVETGVPVVGVEAGDGGGRGGAGGRIERVTVDRDGRTVPYAADQFVLATGGLVGRGVDSSRERVREPVFDCHVPHPDDRYDWFAADPFGDHPFARFGVAVDEALRPVDAEGAVEYGNLRAAGGVLGGADAPAEKSAGGISLATGVAAGRGAAEAVGR